MEGRLGSRRRRFGADRAIAQDEPGRKDRRRPGRDVERRRERRDDETGGDGDHRGIRRRALPHGARRAIVMRRSGGAAVHRAGLRQRAARALAVPGSNSAGRNGIEHRHRERSNRELAYEPGRGKPPRPTPDSGEHIQRLAQGKGTEEFQGSDRSRQAILRSRGALGLIVASTRGPTATSP